MKHIALLTILSALPPLVALAETHEVQSRSKARSTKSSP